MKPFPAVLLQLSGGEPTLRDDLPDIIRKGKELGFIETMVTTNGIRFGKSLDFCKQCVDAGMDAVYLQFDATDSPETWTWFRVSRLAGKVASASEAMKRGDSGELSPESHPPSPTVAGGDRGEI